MVFVVIFMTNIQNRIIMATTLFQGTPVTLAGEFIQKGAPAPDFHW